MTQVLIIEDEPKAARELARMLENIDDEMNIVALLDSVEQSIQWFAGNKQPDLIFSDIQLADGLCFDIYRQVNIQSPVIFCTAFDEYLMKAFDTNAVSYLLKPITMEKVKTALDKFHSMKTAFRNKENRALIGLMKELKYQYKTALLVHHKEKITPIPVKEIAFVYLDKTILNIVTVSNQKYYLSSTLEDIEKVLDPSLFYRANRQYLINKTAITNAERFFARKLVAKLIVETPETIVVSKAKASEFLEWMES
jgi:two-component system response regulator LytT